jgi:hypothetical protein
MSIPEYGNIVAAMETMKKAVLVLGMHRSGTSALTAGLNKAFGICLGPIRDVIDDSNRKGYFENSATWKINNRLLAEMGTSWDSYCIEKTIDYSAGEGHSCQQDALKYLRDNFRNVSSWAMKDPRMSVLLPFWENVLKEFNAQSYRIIVIRHPLEVALSEQDRYQKSSFSLAYLFGSDLRYILNLWFWYNLRLLKDLPDDNNIVVSFDNLLSDPLNEMQRIGCFLGLEPSLEGLNEYTEKFLEKQLKRHNVSDDATEQYQQDYAYVFDLYEKMKACSSDLVFTKEKARSIIRTMPDEGLLSSWALPIQALLNQTRQQLIHYEKSRLIPKIIRNIKIPLLKFISRSQQ